MKYVVLPADGNPEERAGELDVKDVQDIVGGDFEQMPSHSDVTVFAKTELHDDDGFNWAGTRLVQNYLMPTDRVFGTVIVAGPAQAGGSPGDIPEATLQTLQEWHEHRK